MRGMQSKKQPLVEVKGLKKHYPAENAMLFHKKSVVYAVNGVDFAIDQGETLGLVGESGCGKSTIGRGLVGLEKPTHGQILYEGLDLNTLQPNQMKKMRTHIQMIFQDSYSSLNPKREIGASIAYPMRHQGLVTKETQMKEVERLLDLVGLPKNTINRYPYEFSGGQRQRIGIAKALSLKPRFIVCDEPVSALDVSIQAQILNLLKDLQKELNLTYLFIGHGLDAVDYMSNRIAVMYLGKIVEIGPAKEVFQNPMHPYTKALCSAVPVKNPILRNENKIVLKGEVPSNTESVRGCSFEPRCPYAVSSCKTIEPRLTSIVVEGAFKPSHLVACPVINNGPKGKGQADA
jgi:peptide/nickel transport system ATP-binding protein/oligopeptide transport system ATP-binding protein